MMMAVLHEDRRRAGSFGQDADQYDRARLSYPPELIDDVVDAGVRQVLDVGCGTGIAARQFTARGCSVLGIEPDARMAAVARRHGIAVTVAAFAEVYRRHAPELLDRSITLRAPPSPLTSTRRRSPRRDSSGSWSNGAIPGSRSTHGTSGWTSSLRSDHRTMERATLQATLAGISAVIDRLGGLITVNHRTRLITARRIA
jgi:methyltransferase family protein